MQRNKLGLGIFSCIAMTILLSSQANAQALYTFEFNNDSPFDLNQGIGAAQTATATVEEGEDNPTTDVVTVTTVDLIAPEFADDGNGGFIRTGNTLQASNGDLVTTQTNSNSLGIDNPSISDDDFFDGAGIENRDFNDGEGWVIQFDTDVSFTQLDLSSLDDGTLTVTIAGATPVVIADLGLDGDVFEEPFGPGIIPAETTITLEYASPAAASGNFRINSFTVMTGASQSTLLGDVDLSGQVNFLDIAPFIAVLSAGEFQAEADIDESDAVDFLDIAPFIAILSGT